MRYQKGTLFFEDETPGGADALLLRITGVEKMPKKAKSNYTYERIFLEAPERGTATIGDAWFRPEDTSTMDTIHDWAEGDEAEMVSSLDEVPEPIREKAIKSGWD